MIKDEPRRVVRVGIKMTDRISNEISNLLVEYNDIFAQTNKDMSGIDLRIICHQLAIDKNHKPKGRREECLTRKCIRAFMMRWINY